MVWNCAAIGRLFEGGQLNIETDHGGNIYHWAQQLGCLPEQIVDFSANINPEQAVDPGSLTQVSLQPYAEPGYSALKQSLIHRYRYPVNIGIELFNGASAAIFALLRYLQPDKLLLYTPLYGEYARIAGQLGCAVQTIDRFTALGASVAHGSTVVFVNPATPDGTLYPLTELFDRWQSADCTVIIDESFLDFCHAESVAGLIGRYEKLYVIKSLSKFYGCAGIRIGYLLAAKRVIDGLKRFEPAWKLSSFDMAYMQQALANTPFIEHTRQMTKKRREMLNQALHACGLFEQIYPGQANFLLAKLAKQGDGFQLQERLLAAKILIRACANFTGLDKSYVRFAVRDEQAIAYLARQLQIIAL